MTALRFLRLPMNFCGLLCLLLYMPSAGQAAEGCPLSDATQILRTDGDADREIWLFKDAEGIDDTGTGKIGDFKHCQKVLEFNEDYQTIKLLHPDPKKGEVWIMRTGIGLTTDAHVTCLAEDNSGGTMGVRGMGEGCEE